MSFLLNILKYFFEPLPVGPFKFIYVFIGLIVAAIIASIALKIYLKKQKEDKIFKKLFRSVPGKLQLYAFMEAIYVLVRYERMPYLSIRAFNYAIIAYGLYVLITSAQLYIKVYPAEKKHHEHQVNMNKYLPRKGGKKH